MRYLLLVLTVVVSSAVDAQTFKVATLAPDGTAWMQAFRAAADEIKHKTEGRATFRFYPGGVMGSDQSVLRKMRVGQLQGGALAGGGLSEISPDVQLYSMPFLFRSYAEVDHVRPRIDAAIIDGLHENGYVAFGIGEGGFAYLMSDTAVRTTDDLRQRKVWAPEGDEITREAFASIGVAPIPLPLTDVLTGLQTGLIDTVATSPTAGIALQWHTRVKYVTDLPLAYIYGIFVLDRKAFERLAPADQATVRDVMRATFEKLNAQARIDDQSARNALQSQGITFVKPSVSNTEEWERTVAPAVAELKRNAGFSPKVVSLLEQLIAELRRGSAGAQ
ncbi:MAG: C4-dicarboxylate ABC transporter [Thiotrichales bacterium SG8_50]|nr:MAG: C4-dicarboxylate ABC transporter [Thiotrichales bacterium SG8_50]